MFKLLYIFSLVKSIIVLLFFNFNNSSYIVVIPCILYSYCSFGKILSPNNNILYLVYN